jgi:predicted DNA-binding transcriptional regulator YafY
MLETSARLLRLLSLLQVRRDWTGPALAERLEVTTRTVRNDIDRLRRLGYPVEASPGVAGGYRLGESVTMPPMLLDEEEAVAVAIALRTATSASVEGMGEASVRALTKLQRLLPSRLRERVESVRVAALPLPLPATGAHLDPELLVTLAGACRNGERVRFAYETHSGTTSSRDVEPYRLLARDGRWYLFAWDREREDWRTFRADRMALRTPLGPRFAARPLPPDDAIAAHVSRGIDRGTWHFRARVVVHAPADHVRRRIPIPLAMTELAPDRCELVVGSDDPRALAMHLGMLDADFEVIGAPELVAALRELAARLQRAAG